MSRRVEFFADLRHPRSMASRIIRRDSAAFWAFAERVTQKMESWPEWQRRAADAVFITPPAEGRASKTREDRAPAREGRGASLQR